MRFFSPSGGSEISLIFPCLESSWQVQINRGGGGPFAIGSNGGTIKGGYVMLRITASVAGEAIVGGRPGGLGVMTKGNGVKGGGVKDTRHIYSPFGGPPFGGQ